MKAIHLKDPAPCTKFSCGEVLEAGSYFIAECPRGHFFLHFGCPCGTGHRTAIKIQKGAPPPDRNVWGWNGERDNITLAPSIFLTGHPCQWHGYLENGAWRLA